MLEVLCTNTYSSKFVSKFVYLKYTNSRIVIYQHLIVQICIRRVFQRCCLGDARTEKGSKNISFYNSEGIHRHAQKKKKIKYRS